VLSWLRLLLFCTCSYAAVVFALHPLAEAGRTRDNLSGQNTMTHLELVKKNKFYPVKTAFWFVFYLALILLERVVLPFRNPSRV
jgi:hypothetical protein